MADPNLPPHHAAWLAAHPNRSEDWLKARFADGFDVHHIDGDPTNNAPTNLALIEHDDHMRIHAAPLFSRLRSLPLEKQPHRRASQKKRRSRMHREFEAYLDQIRERERREALL